MRSSSWLSNGSPHAPTKFLEILIGRDHRMRIAHHVRRTGDEPPGLQPTIAWARSAEIVD
jgi:hypothetical protein